MIEGKSLKFYDSEAEAQPQDGGIYAVIATITAGIWVAFFARVPAMIVRTGGAGPGARQFDRGCERLRRDPWYREVYLLAQPVRNTFAPSIPTLQRRFLWRQTELFSNWLQVQDYAGAARPPEPPRAPQPFQAQTFAQQKACERYASN